MYIGEERRKRFHQKDSSTHPHLNNNGYRFSFCNLYFVDSKSLRFSSLCILYSMCVKHSVFMKKWKNVLCHCIVNGSYAMYVVSISAHCISSWYEKNMLSKNIYFLFILTARIKSKGNIKIKEKESGSCIYNAILTSFMSCCFLYSWFYHFSIIWFNLRQCIPNCVSRNSKIFFQEGIFLMQDPKMGRETKVLKILLWGVIHSLHNTDPPLSSYLYKSTKTLYL